MFVFCCTVPGEMNGREKDVDDHIVGLQYRKRVYVKDRDILPFTLFLKISRVLKIGPPS